jgi:hypothetical protein
MFSYSSFLLAPLVFLTSSATGREEYVYAIEYRKCEKAVS